MTSTVRFKVSIFAACAVNTSATDNPSLLLILGFCIAEIMSFQVPVRGIVFDLGDVLFTWSPNTNTTISAATLRKILSSSTWFEYECGRLKQDSCYEQIAQELSIEASQVAEAFSKPASLYNLTKC